MKKNFLPENDLLLFNYIFDVFAPCDPILQKVLQNAHNAGLPDIHVRPLDGLHLEILVRICRAQKAVEIGTLAGYSGICIARGLTDDGVLHTIETNPTHAAIAQDSFKIAQVANKIKQYIGNALKVLPDLEQNGPFDLIFIDADKLNYPEYFEWAAQHLRLGGLLIADNTLGWGRIADHEFDEPRLKKAVKSIQKFNELAARSGRFRSTLLPTGEGLTIGIKVK